VFVCSCIKQDPGPTTAALQSGVWYISSEGLTVWNTSTVCVVSTPSTKNGRRWRQWTLDGLFLQCFSFISLSALYLYFLNCFRDMYIGYSSNSLSVLYIDALNYCFCDTYIFIWYQYSSDCFILIPWRHELFLWYLYTSYMYFIFIFLYCTYYLVWLYIDVLSCYCVVARTTYIYIHFIWTIY